MRAARSAGRRLDSATDNMKERIKHGAQELVAHGEAALDSMGTKVRGQVCDRPLTSVLVASGIGLLLGLLISNRKR